MTAQSGNRMRRRTETWFWVAATLGVPIFLAASALRTLGVEMVLEHNEVSMSDARAIAVITTLAALVICIVLLWQAVLDWMRGAAIAAAIVGLFFLAAAVIML